MLNIHRTTLSRRSDSTVSGHEKMTVTKNFSDNPQNFLKKTIHNEVKNDLRQVILRFAG